MKSSYPYLRTMIITLHGKGSSIILLFVVVRSKSFLVETKAEDDAANIQDSVKNRRMDPSKGIALCYSCRGRACRRRRWCVGQKEGEVVLNPDAVSVVSLEINACQFPFSLGLSVYVTSVEQLTFLTHHFIEDLKTFIH